MAVDEAMIAAGTVHTDKGVGTGSSFGCGAVRRQEALKPLAACGAGKAISRFKPPRGSPGSGPRTVRAADGVSLMRRPAQRPMGTGRRTECGAEDKWEHARSISPALLSGPIR